MEVVCSYFDSQRHGGWLDASDQLAGLDVESKSFACAAGIGEGVDFFDVLDCSDNVKGSCHFVLCLNAT